jgi:hypothetical protein
VTSFATSTSDAGSAGFPARGLIVMRPAFSFSEGNPIATR